VRFRSGLAGYGYETFCRAISCFDCITNRYSCVRNGYENRHATGGHAPLGRICGPIRQYKTGPAQKADPDAKTISKDPV